MFRVERGAAGFAVHTSGGVWFARNVVVATGYHSHPKIPDLAVGLAPGIAQVGASSYRSPASLPAGGVLVVGASASGVQIADELARAGRPVVLAVGCHTRLPRRYRGRDILWWLDRIGSLDRSIDQVPDAEAARAEPSLQLVGSEDTRGLDLGVLQAAGVQLTGRLRVLDGTIGRFSDDLADTIAAPPDPPPVIAVPAAPSRIHLRRAGIAAVVWATGFRPRYPWLAVPVLDHHGRIRYRRGVTEVPGLYAIGLRFQSRRSSTFVDGARHDAAYLADQITAHRAARVA